MFAKLAFRNVTRSARDYAVYVMTMAMVTAMMYAFNSLLFDNGLSAGFDIDQMMSMMTGLATFFIVLLVAWLINYMVRFMLEKRSSEFGIYMLLGMKKGTIARLYMRENFLLGIVAFVPGVFGGMFLQQVLLAILCGMIRTEYQFQVTFHADTFLTTVLIYGGCYLLALLRCRRKFKKMNISDLMNARHQNEEIRESHMEAKRILFPVSVLFLIAAGTVLPLLTNTLLIGIYLVMLVAVIYLFYMGLSAWIVCYIRRGGKGIYKGQNLFLLRQFSSKVRSMQFTMGTLTALFAVALMGCSVALMFTDFENKILGQKWPFDVTVYSADVTDDFQEELDILSKDTNIRSSHIYRIYTNQSDQANVWMYTHVSTWGTMYRKADGSPDLPGIRKALKTDGIYCTYDTYMGLSDYNYLRRMLGYREITLGEDGYAIQIKERLRSDAEEMPAGLKILDSSGDKELLCAGIYTEPFAQDGQNGGDYLLIVPDSIIRSMTPYYSELAVNINGEMPDGIQKKLDGLVKEEERDFGGHAETLLEGNSCGGSDNFVVYVMKNLVRDNLIPEVKYMLASVIMPAFYIGLVFICVVMTVLAVHQLSDSAKYKFRYDVLSKIGLGRSQINCLIAKQLFVYYLCPALFAIAVSGNIVLRLSKGFIEGTGVKTNVLQYFGTSCLLFFSIYLIYFAATYVGFKRNIERK